jgi:hypothetical protein
MNELDRQPRVGIARTMAHGRAVCMALQEVNPGHGRQAFEIVDAETQRTIHHAVDREPMLLHIDVGEVRRMILNEVERGRGNDARIILKRSVVGNVIDAESGPSAQELAVIGGVVGWYFSFP